MPFSDFSSRAASSSRPKVFLGDLEYAKKEEWERRRKLRLKQVRQQARDIASIIRNQTGTAKKKRDELNKCVQHESAVKSTENAKVELQQKLTECLTSVGTGHSSAAMMTEVDELLQHKIELQDTLARVRGELAAEKAKEIRKPRQELVGCPRDGISISKITRAAQKPNIRKMSPPKMKPRATVPATPPNFIGLPCSMESEEHPGGIDDSVVQIVPTEKTIFSPPMLARKKNKKCAKSPVNGRKSCPPITESIDALDSSPDSDDSGQTWPPVSVRRKKTTKVRMYDHSDKKCSEYVQQCEVIRMDNPTSSNMKDLIHKEEELLSKKTEGELESRKVELQRGLNALRKEVAKQDFDTAIRDLCQSSVEKRFRKAHNYQPPAARDLNRKHLQPGTSEDKTQQVKRDGPQGVLDGRPMDQPSQYRPPAPVDTGPLQSIVTKLAEQREAILQDVSQPSDDSTSSNDGDSEDEGDRLPLWIQAELNAQNAKKDLNDRVVTPETVMENMNGVKKSTTDEGTNNVSSDLSSFIRHEQEFELSESTNSPKHHNSSSKSVSQDGQSSSKGTNVSQSSSSAGINVQIQIRRESPEKRLPVETPKKEVESSTSYYSPPEKLSPQQISVLSDILSKMSIKNRNPILHQYITRVLEMSHQSLSDLDVSRCSSDFSIQSELFSHTKGPSSRNYTDVGNKQDGKVAKNRVCLRELDNLSTAGTVCSSPRMNSIGNAPSPNHSGKIAELLRNIIELQRVYDAHTSSDPSLTVLSESHSSYHSVPAGIDAKHYQDVAPVAGNAVNYCEDTGIFLNRQDTSQGAEHPTLASLLNGHYFNLPAQLLPNPFAEPGKENDGVRNRQSTFPDFNELADIPDGYSRKPEMDPGSVYFARRDPNKVFNTLSDIESVVSSIQSTPRKRGVRPTSPSQSLPADDVSSVSGISSRDFISSQELLNNDLINTTSSSSNFEDVFQSLGLGWALSTLRRTRTSKNLRAEDSSSKSGSLPSSEKTKSGTGYHHSTPMKGSNPTATQLSPENDHVPSLTPPNIALHCPNWRK